MIIVGIDPGSQTTGFGVLSLDRDKIKHLEHGTFELSETLLPRRLLQLSEQLDQLLKRFSADIVALERIFVGKNVDSAFKLGHARGVCMLSAARAGCTLVEYAAREVKKGITGSGAAEKEQVAILVKAQLEIPREIVLKLDATDALGIALHHALRLQSEKKLSRLDENLTVRKSL